LTNPIGVNCSIAAALGEIGEKWSLLILREAIMGSTRFDEFQANLGIARNILTDRLLSLAAHGVLTRDPVPGHARIHHYHLTQKGRDLLPVLAALMQWGDRWLHRDIGAPVVLVDRATQHPIRMLGLAASDGRALAARDVAITAGPGATELMRKRLASGRAVA
jgi:DNA-binding HxlR family transcriptional regulator